MSAPPFANATEGDAFVANRCRCCPLYDHEVDGPCDQFTPAFFGEWPDILYRTRPTRDNPLGVECDWYQQAIEDDS